MLLCAAGPSVLLQGPPCMPTPQRDAGASTGPCVECAPCGFHARHSSRDLAR